MKRLVIRTQSAQGMYYRCALESAKPLERSVINFDGFLLEKLIARTPF